jgi:hypothetical protein
VYIGVYFCLSGFFILLSLLLVTIVRKRVGLFLVASGSTNLLRLVMFELFSNYFNIIKLRGLQSFNFPGNYHSKGFAGWTNMIVPILGITSPLVITLLIDKQTPKSE